MSLRHEAFAELFKGRHFNHEIVTLCVRWYVTYKLSYRDLVEMMAERHVDLAHTTIMRWVQRYVPEFVKRWQCYTRSVGTSWRCDETYIRIKGHWAYLYRAVVRSVPSKWRQARDEGLRLKRSLITWTVRGAIPLPVMHG